MRGLVKCTDCTGAQNRQKKNNENLSLFLYNALLRKRNDAYWPIFISSLWQSNCSVSDWLRQINCSRCIARSFSGVVKVESRTKLWYFAQVYCSLMVIISIVSETVGGYFEGEHVGTAFPLLQCLRTHYERHCEPFSAINTLYRRIYFAYIIFFWGWEVGMTGDTPGPSEVPPVFGPTHQFPLGSQAFPLFLFYKTSTGKSSLLYLAFGRCDHSRWSSTSSHLCSRRRLYTVPRIFQYLVDWDVDNNQASASALSNTSSRR